MGMVLPPIGCQMFPPIGVGDILGAWLRSNALIKPSRRLFSRLTVSSIRHKTLRLVYRGQRINLANSNVPRWKVQRLVVGEKDAIR